MPQASSSYHHGDLRAACLRAARELLEEDGSAGLSLRAVARRAGVSATAPYRHYADRDALVSAVAAEGYRELAGELASAHPAPTTPTELGGRRRLRAFRARPPGHVPGHVRGAVRPGRRGTCRGDSRHLRVRPRHGARRLSRRRPGGALDHGVGPRPRPGLPAPGRQARLLDPRGGGSPGRVRSPGAVHGPGSDVAVGVGVGATSGARQLAPAPVDRVSAHVARRLWRQAGAPGGEGHV